MKLEKINGLIFALFALAFVSAVFNQSAAADTTAIYDAQLAENLGADEYGMKSYVLVILKTGPNDEIIIDKDKRSELFRGHFANMNRLAKEGLLVLAGPLMEDKPKRGLLIFNVTNLEEADALIKTDPAVAAGIFVYELTAYYGSAALMQINQIHKTIQKTAIE